MDLSDHQDVPDPSRTVFALSSAPGRSAIAVVRMSGPDAFAAAQALGANNVSAGRASLRRLVDPQDASPIDEALVLGFRAPASATGEDVIEFHCHGSRAVVTALLDALGRQPGCRPAEPGEFTQRAFVNGKLDLTAAEGLADLIDAETALQRKQAFHQFDGGLVRQYDGWRAKLRDAMALVESGIDFSDEADVAEGAYAHARREIEALQAELIAHLANAHRGEIIRDGFKVALAGAPNAGKSSLLNALAARDVAIVSHEAGTTRDVIEVKLDLGGVPVVVSDTAGLREGGGAIEREGMRRARTRIAQADLVIWLIDAADPILPPTDIAAPANQAAHLNAPSENPEGEARLTDGVSSPVFTVVNKIDLFDGAVREITSYDSAISVKDGRGLDKLVAYIVEAAHTATQEPAMPPPTAPRHRAHLRSALRHLETFLAADPALIELRAEDLRLAAAEFGRLTGRIDSEEVLGAIFSRFCIGK